MVSVLAGFESYSSLHAVDDGVHGLVSRNKHVLRAGQNRHAVQRRPTQRPTQSAGRIKSNGIGESTKRILRAVPETRQLQQ